MSIKIIGDVHGKTGDYKRLVRNMEPGQRSIDQLENLNGALQLPLRAEKEKPMKTAEYSDYKKLGDGLVTVKIVVCGEHDPSRVVAAIESAIKILSSGLQSPALSSFEPDYDA